MRASTQTLCDFFLFFLIYGFILSYYKLKSWFKIDSIKKKKEKSRNHELCHNYGDKFAQ